MSLAALSWAWQAQTGSPEAKLLLLAYATHARDDGTGAFPSVQQLTQIAECSGHAIHVLSQNLVESGFMRLAPDGPDAFALDRFDLAMSEETRAAWRAERS